MKALQEPKSSYQANMREKAKGLVVPPYCYLKRKNWRYYRCGFCNNNINKSYTHCWYCGVELNWEGK